MINSTVRTSPVQSTPAEIEHADFFASPPDDATPFFSPSYRVNPASEITDAELIAGEYGLALNLVTMRELMAFFATSRATIQNMVKIGVIPAEAIVRFGPEQRFDLDIVRESYARFCNGDEDLDAA